MYNDTRVEQKHFRGIGEVGIALEWHSRGQGFESPMLHQVFLVKNPYKLAVLRVLFFLVNCKIAGYCGVLTSSGA